MRNNWEPQTAQAPCTAMRPFFMVISRAFSITRFSLHFMQYASTCVLTVLLVSLSPFACLTCNSGERDAPPVAPELFSVEALASLEGAIFIASVRLIAP